MSLVKPANQLPHKEAFDASEVLPSVEVYCDPGHGYGKFICDNRRSVFPTLIASVQADTANFASLRNSRPPFVIDIDDQSYAIGDDALEARRNLRRRLDQSGLGGELHRVIVLAGLTQVVPGSATVRLITQMPISWYSQREKLFDLAGSYLVQYGGKKYRYVLRRQNMVIYPESWGTIACYCYNQAGEKVHAFDDAKVAVIDAGTETTNIGMYEGLRFVAQQSFTLSAGMSDVWEHIAAAINRDYGRRPALDDIDHALRDRAGIFLLGATRIDLNADAYLPAGVHHLAQTIISEVQNRLEGGTLGNYFIGGGGGWPYIRQAMTDAFGAQLLNAEDFPTVAKLEPWLLNVTGLRRFEAYKRQISAR